MPLYLQKDSRYLFLYFKYQYGCTNLYTNVKQEHSRSDALTDTIVIRQEWNTGPLVRKTHALPIAPRPLPTINIITSMVIV